MIFLLEEQFDVQINERGQITIPKELRDKVNIHPKENLKISIDNQGRLILCKKDLLDDLEDLIKRDLMNEGYTEEDFVIEIPERKKRLAKALLKMVEESKKEFEEGKCTSLEDLKQEFKDEGLL
jgi:AbrB family looped-hinge helix DNA binding protein